MTFRIERIIVVVNVCVSLSGCNPKSKASLQVSERMRRQSQNTDVESVVGSEYLWDDQMHSTPQRQPHRTSYLVCFFSKRFHLLSRWGVHTLETTSLVLSTCPEL